MHCSSHGQSLCTDTATLPFKNKILFYETSSCLPGCLPKHSQVSKPTCNKGQAGWAGVPEQSSRRGREGFSSNKSRLDVIGVDS